MPPEGPAALAFHDGQVRLVVESGTFDVMVGSGSEPLTTVTLEVAGAEA